MIAPSVLITVVYKYTPAHIALHDNHTMHVEYMTYLEAARMLSSNMNTITWCQK